MEINKKEILKQLMFQINIYKQENIIEDCEHMENIVEDILEKYI